MAAQTASIPERIPSYLRPYVIQQDASCYTAIDHASWRFILKLSKRFFAGNAHAKYLDGLKATGISSERIPSIHEMNDKLSRFGWNAVAISGFIPPAAFMEFLSLSVLPIACDMRQLEHLSYTPAPDIVHEAAGHAPIIADPAYARYLKSYGEISRKAIPARSDLEMYHAIRELSEIKEDPASTAEQIQAAQKKLDQLAAQATEESEAAQLSRMGWWTFEYGLVGPLGQPKIYGAGLLSSLSESFHCLGPGVKKLPFTLDCVATSYDITKPQPQLFVSPNFETLIEALDQLAETMAFRRGGVEGLEKALRSGTVTTAELESGLQISGVLKAFRKSPRGDELAYLNYEGPAQLSRDEKEIPGQGPDYHTGGFGCALGKILPFGKPAHLLSDAECEQLLLKPGKRVVLDFSTGVHAEGRFREMIRDEKGRPCLLVFDECQVKLGEKILFEPAWGPYDMACGSEVVSVFAGAADRERYFQVTGGFQQPPRGQKTNLTPANQALNQLYAKVREIRENAKPLQNHLPELKAIHDRLESHHPQDWLLSYELLEIVVGKSVPWESTLRSRLDSSAATSENQKEVIGRAMQALGSA